MQRILIAALIWLSGIAFACAQSQPGSILSNLPFGGAISNTDLFYDVQTPGVLSGSVKVTGAQFKTFIFGAVSGGCTATSVGVFSCSGGSGTVTSVAAGCAGSTGGAPITTSGTISAQELIDLETGANFAIPNGDCGFLVNLSNAAVQTPTIANPGSGGGFLVGWFADVCNIGAGTQTLTPSNSTINGASTAVLKTNDCIKLVSDGLNWQTAGMGWLSKASGGGTPGGANTDVQFNNSSAFGGDAGFTYAGNGQATLALGTITTNLKALNITGTFNAVGTTFDAPLFMNVTNTTSAAGSLLIDIKIGGTTALSFGVNGTLSIIQPAAISTTVANTIVFNPAGGNNMGFSANSGGSVINVIAAGANPISLGWATGIQLAKSQPLVWGADTFDTGNADTGISRDNPGVVDVGTNTVGDVTGAIQTRSYVHRGAAPTFTGTCTAPASSAGGNTAGTFTVGAGGACAGGTYIMTFAFTAPTGWACDAEDRSTTTDTVQQTATAPTTATLKATVANNDVVQFKCAAY
jgi:hypothetical protein